MTPNGTDHLLERTRMKTDYRNLQNNKQETSYHHMHLTHTNQGLPYEFGLLQLTFKLECYVMAL